jgi:hypothetical protein
VIVIPEPSVRVPKRGFEVKINQVVVKKRKTKTPQPKGRIAKPEAKKNQSTKPKPKPHSMKTRGVVLDLN